MDDPTVWALSVVALFYGPVFAGALTVGAGVGLLALVRRMRGSS